MTVTSLLGARRASAPIPAGPGEPSGSTVTIPAPRESAEQGAAPPAQVVRIVRDTEPVAPASIRAVTRPRPGTGYARHRFLVGGTVAILSDVDLPELEYFRVPALGQDVDIEIRKGLGRATARPGGAPRSPSSRPRPRSATRSTSGPSGRTSPSTWVTTGSGSR